MSSSVPCRNARDSSHSTLTASRAFFADQKSSAITATPLATGVSKATTSATHFILRAVPASKRFSRAPKRGGRITSAVIIPGSFRSCVNTAVPFDFATASMRGTERPM